MFKVVSLKPIMVGVAFLMLSIILGVGVVQVVSMNAVPKSNYTIVLDAGHGGRDGGSVGINGTVEKEINLEYTLLLKKKLTNLGYRVILTRQNDDGLYSEFASNKKLSDMNARFEIIKKANPNLVISIHMNSFKDKSANGANTYYRKDDQASKQIADLVQQSIYTYCNAKQTSSQAGDYFILNCSYYSSILVECGFISNQDEEQLLNSEDYKQKFTDAIINALVIYFGNNKV